MNDLKFIYINIESAEFTTEIELTLSNKTIFAISKDNFALIAVLFDKMQQNSSAQYTRSLSNDSFDVSSVQILLDSEVHKRATRQRNVMIGVGIAIVLFSVALVIAFVPSTHGDVENSTQSLVQSNSSGYSTSTDSSVNTKGS